MRIKTNFSFLLKRTILLSAVVLAVRAADAASSHDAPLTVELVSGRQFTGRIDPRSDGETLWLRFERGPARLLRPVQWDRIARAEMAGEAVSVEDMAGAMEYLESVPQGERSAHGSPLELPQPSREPTPPADSGHDAFAKNLQFTASESPVRPKVARVSMILADAWLANWDGDVENDGIVVQVVPLDAAGRVVPVSGTLDVVLVGPSVRRFSEAPTSRGVKLDRLGHWVRSVRGEEVQNGTDSYRLPFQAAHPQFDWRVGSHAFVSIRLTVPGHGTFQRTIDYVRIRPNSPLRDYEQLRTGRRWLSFEQTGRGKRVAP